MNVFEAVKQSVTTRQAASYYGIRVGRNGMACCPFHNDRTPSMKVDSRYYCFGCGASGDVIDFAASLHGLGKRDAAVRLAEDFSIPYDGAIRTPAAKRTPPKPTPEQRLRQAEQHYFKVLCDYLHLLERWKIEYAPQPQDAAWHPLFVEALQKNSYVEYLLDILLFGEMEEKAALIAEQGKEVVRLEQRISDKVPYETHPADRLRQCVFGGTTNRQDFLPRDRTGNRRFIPVTVYPERAEVHILDDEAAARTYISQMWAEAMTIYRSGKYKLSFSAEMNAYLKAHQQGFMQEDTQAGMIYAYLEDYTGDRVCSKQLYEEALGNLNSPADWETRAICEIMNTGIAGGIIQGWVAYKSPKRYKKYGSQKGWERVNQAPPEGDGFQEITEEEARQMELPF